MIKTSNGVKLIYIANIRLPTEKAHGLEVMKLCEAFAKSGLEVELIIPRAFNKLKGDSFEFYRVEKNFKIKKLPGLDFLFLNRLPSFFFLIRSFSFSFFALVYFLFLKISGGLKNVVFFSHDHIPLYFISFLNLPFVFDIHDFPSENIFYRRVLKNAVGFSVQTKWKIRELEKHFSIPSSKIVYWPNGVDMKEFSTAISRNEARRKLGLPGNEKIILYTGHLFSWKGIDTLAMAGCRLENARLYFVGGTDIDIEKFRNKYGRGDNIIIIGHKPHQEIPFWQKAADVLVLPNTAKEDISKFYTSPMKLFEYMASGRPIAASNIPSITEILNKDNSVLVDADNSEELAIGIKKILADSNLAEKISRQAYLDVQKYTWTERARRIRTLFNNTNNY